MGRARAGARDRLKRAELRRKIKAGERSVEDVLRRIPAYAETMTLGRLLRWQSTDGGASAPSTSASASAYGDVPADRLSRRNADRVDRTLGKLTDRHGRTVIADPRADPAKYAGCLNPVEGFRLVAWY